MPDVGSAATRTTGELTSRLGALQVLEFEDAVAYLADAEALAAATRQAQAPAILRIRVLSELGNARRTAGRFSEAISVLDEAITAAEQLPEGNERDELLALAHLRAAIAFDVAGSLVEGFDHIDKSTSYYRASQDKGGLARCDMVRAALYLRMEDFEESEACYRRALVHYRQTGETERIGVTLTNLSTILRYQNRTEEAIAAGRESLDYATSTLLETTARGNLASALGEDGQLEEALEMHRSTEETIKALGHPNYVITYKRSVGTILAQQGELEAAIAMLSEALAEAGKLGFQRDVTECHGLLAQAYADSGDFAQAYRHQREYHQGVQEQNHIKAANQLEFHKWRFKLEAAQRQADEERQRRQRLADSFDEISSVNKQLSARAAELEWSSYRDSLTELANRRYFDQRLGDFTERSIETGEDLSVLVLDLDRFKDVNDCFGHLIGDKVLRAVAQIMRATTRRSDLPARLGGEEFAILLTSDVHLASLHSIAEKLRQAFVEYDWDTIAPGLRVTVSIGAARLSEADRNPLRLLQLADQRLYAAKRAGRNKVVTAGTGSQFAPPAI